MVVNLRARWISRDMCKLSRTPMLIIIKKNNDKNPYNHLIVSSIFFPFHHRFNAFALCSKFPFPSILLDTYSW